MPGADDQPPLSGGIFRRLGKLLGRWGGVSVPVIEELYGPTRNQARQQVQEQRQAAEPSPSPADPPAGSAAPD